MSTKTISVDLTAYEKLCRARRDPGESFSQVIRRAHWEASTCNGTAFLETMRRLPPLDEATIDALDEGQRLDRHPEDKWRNP